jgi:hypothetical protein
MKNFDSEEAHAFLLVMGIVGLIMLGGLTLGIIILDNYTIETSSTDIIITTVINKDFGNMEIITQDGIFNTREKTVFNSININKKYLFIVINNGDTYYNGLIKEYYELSEGV